MNISLCSQSRAFIDAAEYQPQPFPVDRRVPVMAPGYESYVNTGYPGFSSFLTPFGWTQYSPIPVVEQMPLDERSDNLLPPLVFVNGRPIHVEPTPTDQPREMANQDLNHQTMIPGSAKYSRLPKPTVEVCNDNGSMVLQRATEASQDVWGTGSDFVLRRPMPNIFINGRTAAQQQQANNGGGGTTLPLFLLIGLAAWAMS